MLNDLNEDMSKSLNTQTVEWNNEKISTYKSISRLTKESATEIKPALKILENLIEIPEVNLIIN